MVQDHKDGSLEEQDLEEVKNIEVLWTALNIGGGGMKIQVLIENFL